MAEELVVTIKKKQALKVLDELVERKMITMESKLLKNLSPKKKKQAKDFLQALNEAKHAEQGKIKLKTFDTLISEL